MLSAHMKVFLGVCLWGAAAAYYRVDDSSLMQKAEVHSRGRSFIQKARMPLKAIAPTVPREFQVFMKKHGHKYAVGTEEYEKRISLFAQRLEEVEELNARPGRLWTAGINRLSDRTDDELHRLRGWRGGAKAAGHRHSLVRSHAGIAFISLSGRQKPLPNEVSWAHLNATKQIKDQGSCGSCWAIASATVLEAHSEIHVPEAGARSFSTQELVSCVPNVDNCGGKGGCDGATVELAFDWALSNGLVQESEHPYQEVTGECKRTAQELLAIQAAPSSTLTAPGEHNSAPGMKGLSFGMTGWERLPENGYEPLMRALVERGPVAVSAAASKWFSYEGGVFDHCDRDAVIDHAVTLIGYGEDTALDQKYWLIQNSWGPEWGEAGRIRLLRQDGDEQESCGTDRQPELGTGCKGGPAKVTVCGQCGVLYDSVVPHFGEADAEAHWRKQLGQPVASH